MFSISIEALECAQSCRTVYVQPLGLTFVIEPEKVDVLNYGPVILYGTITEADADKMDMAVIESRWGEPSEPLDKALGDLGI